MNWFTRMDGYGKFLFILFGIPAIIAAFVVAGFCGIAIVKENGWYTIPVMTFYPVLCIGFALGMMGAFNGSHGESMFNRDWSDAKCFCVFWASTSGLATIALGVPAIVVYYSVATLRSIGVL